MEYNDEYPTCKRTFATVRIYGVPAERVSRALEHIPTHSQRAVVDAAGAIARPDAWFLSSEGEVESRDVRRHLDWCLDRLETKAEALTHLIKYGASIDIFCYWLSSAGHGGPIVSPKQARRLAVLGLDCGFDVHCHAS